MLRRVTKATFVNESFTRKGPKQERFIRPMALRYKKANVTHPELKTTFQLPIIGVKKNPQSPMYTQLGVLTKGTIVEVNISELGMVTAGGKVAWAKYAQITNSPENDGCIVRATIAIEAFLRADTFACRTQCFWCKEALFPGPPMFPGSVVVPCLSYIIRSFVVRSGSSESRSNLREPSILQLLPTSHGLHL